MKRNLSHQDYLARATAVINEKIKQTTLLRESNSVFANEQKQRNKVKDYNTFGHRRFLTANDIEKGIEYGIEDVYMTTLGGVLRPLTNQDLKALKHNIDLLNQQYSKGITAKKVIDLSLSQDKERSNKQIHMVLPLSIKGNVVRFMTNASGEHGRMEHYIHVQFETITGALLGGDFSQDVARKISLGKLKFECDCEHHRYVYRYLATVAGWNYGREEYAYPKIRNPTLAGVACKHVLRVMQYIRNPSFSQYLFKVLEKQRKTALSSSSQKTSEARLRHKVDKLVEKGLKDLKHNLKHAEQEMIRLETKRQKRIETQQRQAERKRLAETAKKHGKETARRIEQQLEQKIEQQMINALREMKFTEQQIANFRRKR